MSQTENEATRSLRKRRCGLMSTHKNMRAESSSRLREALLWPEMPKQTSPPALVPSPLSASGSQYSAAPRLVMSPSNHILVLLAEGSGFSQVPLTGRNNESAENETVSFPQRLPLLFHPSAFPLPPPPSSVSLSAEVCPVVHTLRARLRLPRAVRSLSGPLGGEKKPSVSG